MSRVIASETAAAASTSASSGLSGGLLVGSETNGYTLQRYRAILHDYSNEFRKTRDSLNAARQRAELLLPAASPTGSLASSTSSPNSLRPRSDLLLREKSSLHSSLRMADDIISQAAEARESLLGQSSMFQAMRGRVLGIRQRFPLLHSVMSRIERQRKKDAIVIAAVIATCICFTVVYISNKPID
jgi:Golgi SNAP receptor complex protein 1